MFSRTAVLTTLVQCILLCLSVWPSLGTAGEISTKCGVRNVGGVDVDKLKPPVGGVGESDFGEFPWTVDLKQDQKSFCAGSLIHPKVVLTAGHCMTYLDGKDFTIRAGVWNQEKDNERLPYQERGVEKIIIHPQRYKFSNNFALIILNEPFTLAAHINVICLPTSNHLTANGTSCYASGWGRVADKPSVIMKRVILSTVDLKSCQSKLDSKLVERLDESVICAVGHNGTDTCNGDSGGPMVCPVDSGSEEQYELIGITSFGATCNSDLPGGYANVGSVRSWIDEVISAHGL